MRLPRLIVDILSHFQLYLVNAGIDLSQLFKSTLFVSFLFEFFIIVSEISLNPVAPKVDIKF